MANDRFEEIEAFLQMLAQKTKDGQEIEVYTELCNYGLKPEEIGEEIKLSDVEKSYRRQTLRQANIRQRLSASMVEVPGWLLHRSKLTEVTKTENDPVSAKLYIPVSSSEICDVATKIFCKFIETDIIQESKISNKVRADNFVSRILLPDEAKEMLDYINENCSEQIRTTNPFMTRCGKVGLAMDDSISYNFMVSKLIDGYLKASKEENELDNVSGQGLSEYVKSLRETIFTKGKGICEFAHDRNGQLEDVSDSEYLYSSKIVMDLLINALDKEKTVEDFMKYWENTNMPKKKEEELKKLKKLLEVEHQNEEKNTDAPDLEELRETCEEKEKESLELAEEITEKQDILADVDKKYKVLQGEIDKKDENRGENR